MQPVMGSTYSIILICYNKFMSPSPLRCNSGPHPTNESVQVCHFARFLCCSTGFKRASQIQHVSVSNKGPRDQIITVDTWPQTSRENFAHQLHKPNSVSQILEAMLCQLYDVHMIWTIAAIYMAPCGQTMVFHAALYDSFFVLRVGSLTMRA